MPAGQVYRLTRAQRQQQRQFDPSLLGLQLTDETALNTVPWRQTTASYLRYQGHQRRAQWPVQSRDVNPLQSADQPLIDLEPWTPTPATYLRYRGRPQQAQWPTYPRLNATDLQLADQDVNLLPTPMPAWRRTSRAQWQQAKLPDPNEFPAGLPDQDVNLVPVSARMWRPASRAAYQQAVYFDLGGLGLELADQDVALRPITAVPPRGRASQGAQWKVQFFTDPLILNPPAPDQDVNLVPVSARRWRPPSRAPFQQAKYFDLAGLGLQLTDQDVRLVPVSSPSSAFLRYRGRQVWYTRVFYPTVDVPSAGPLLVPPLFTLFATDGSTLTSAVDTGIRAVVTSDDGRRTTIFLSSGLMITLKTNP